MSIVSNEFQAGSPFDRRRAARPRSPRRSPRQQPEKIEQQHIVHLLRSLGAKVYVLGTRRKAGDYQGTMQTPGIADLEAWLKRDGGRQLLKIEVKAKAGRLRPEQDEYRQLCQTGNVAYVIGGLDMVIGWLLANKHIRHDQVAHYRVPGGRL